MRENIFYCCDGRGQANAFKNLLRIGSGVRPSTSVKCLFSAPFRAWMGGSGAWPVRSPFYKTIKNAAAFLRDRAEAKSGGMEGTKYEKGELEWKQ